MADPGKIRIRNCRRYRAIQVVAVMMNFSAGVLDAVDGSVLMAFSFTLAFMCLATVLDSTRKINRLSRDICKPDYARISCLELKLFGRVYDHGRS